MTERRARGRLVEAGRGRRGTAHRLPTRRRPAAPDGAGYEALSASMFPATPGPEAALGAATDLGILPSSRRDASARRWRGGTSCRRTASWPSTSSRSRSGTRRWPRCFEDAGDLRGIVVEVTERRAVDDPRRSPARSRRGAGLGAKVAVDDAGAGHSGLQRILALRPEFLKLDGSLVRGIDGDEAKAALVEMIGVFARPHRRLAAGRGRRDPGRCAAPVRASGCRWRRAGTSDRPAAPWEPVRSEACAALRAGRALEPGGAAPARPDGAARARRATRPASRPTSSPASPGSRSSWTPTAGRSG